MFISKNTMDNIKISIYILISIGFFIESNRYKISDYYHQFFWKLKQIKKKYLF